MEIDLLNSINLINTGDFLISPLDENEFITSTEDIDINIDCPNLVISSEDLIRALSLSSTVVQVKSDNVVYNSLVFISNGGNAKIFVTNELSQLVYNINPIQNSLDLIFSVPLTLIQKIIKLIGKKTMFYIKDDKLYIRLLSGDLLLDLRIPNANLIKLPIYDFDFSETYEIPLNSLGRIVSSMLPILNTELRSDFKKISFLGDKVFFLSPFYYIESNIKTPNMSVRIKDAEFISRLSKYYPNKTVKLGVVRHNINRIQITLENITYVFISGYAEMDASVEAQLESLIKPINIAFNYDRFNKIINLATTLTNLTGEIRLSITDKDLVITLRSSSGDSKFSINYDLLNPITNTEVVLRADPFKKLLTALSTTGNIGLALTDTGVILEKEGIRAILMKSE